jgi:glycosidase
MVKKFLLLFCFLLTLTIPAQNLSISKIEPPNWWTGMKLNKIQLMIYGHDLNNAVASFNNNSIKILKVDNAESPSYLFIDIEIPANIKSGNYKLTLKKNGLETSIDYPVQARQNKAGRYQGFNPSDVLYLIMPDRFADGDTSNNIITGMPDEYNIQNPIARHGGDIQGIINHLDYLKNLNITTLWLCPVLENNTDVHFYGYAGYSATDLYKVDPRLGTNELYKQFVNDAHAKGLKVILDHVSNHISISHPWMNDLPFKDWINGSVENHFSTRHDKLAFADIHRDTSTIINTTKGWFTNYLPDLNQANPYVSNYLIENTIWWIESTGLDGIREDTYPYCDQVFLSNWAKAILTEYPELNIVGEVWTGDAVFLSSFQKGNYYPKQFDTNLPAVTDFATYDVYTAFLKGSATLQNIYEDFAKDFIYKNPQDLVTFIDNHDVLRAMMEASGDVNKFKMAVTMLLTSRGIPEIFYGTEIGMPGGKDDGTVRADFPGGFPGDKQDAFIKEGRTKSENDIYNFVTDVLKLRRAHKALSIGNLIQYPPMENIFVYFKNYNDDRIMVIMNGNNVDKEINLSRYSDQLKYVKRLKNLVTGTVLNFNANDSLNVEKTSGNLFLLEY